MFKKLAVKNKLKWSKISATRDTNVCLRKRLKKFYKF